MGQIAPYPTKPPNMRGPHAAVEHVGPYLAVRRAVGLGRCLVWLRVFGPRLFRRYWAGPRLDDQFHGV